MLWWRPRRNCCGLLSEPPESNVKSMKAAKALTKRPRPLTKSRTYSGATGRAAAKQQSRGPEWQPESAENHTI